MVAATAVDEVTSARPHASAQTGTALRSDFTKHPLVPKRSRELLDRNPEPGESQVIFGVDKFGLLNLQPGATTTPTTNGSAASSPGRTLPDAALVNKPRRNCPVVELF